MKITPTHFPSLEQNAIPKVGQAGSFNIEIQGFEMKVNYKPSFSVVSDGLEVDHLEFFNVFQDEPMPLSHTGYRSHFVYRPELQGLCLKKYVEGFVGEFSTKDVSALKQLSMF